MSVAVGEQKLVLAIRDASPHTLIITDGFSCASQIKQLTDRGALHLARVVQMALREGSNGPGAARPETSYSQSPAPETNGLRSKATVAGGALAALGGASVLAGRRR